MVHVPYRGVAPALTDLIGGQVQVNFSTMSSSIEYIRAGKVRALAVTTATRSEALPDLPTVGEFVPGYETSNWFGLGAPNGTPVEIIDKLNREINAGLADPKIKARLADFGGTPLVGSPADSSRQNAWIVPTNISAMPGISPSDSRVRVTMRSFSSAAALSVNVNAMMLRGRSVSGRPGVSNCTTRRATTSVLPEPAQAMSWRLRPL